MMLDAFIATFVLKMEGVPIISATTQLYQTASLGSTNVTIFQG